MAQPQFLYNIPSIHQRHPAMPESIRNLDFNTSILAGDVLQYDCVEQAKVLATSLKSLHDSEYEPLVTEEIVAAATSRAVAVETAYAAVEYSPQNLVQALVDINHQLQMIGLRVEIGLARTANSMLINRNKYLRGQQLEPLQKVVPGYGRNTALPFVHVLNAAGQNLFQEEFPPNPGVNAIPEIGTTPPNFQAMLDNYGHIDIIRVIVFYNQSFSIVPQDNIGARVDKFRRFLTDY